MSVRSANPCCKENVCTDNVLFCCFSALLFMLQEVLDLKEKLDKCELELEKTRKNNELCFLPLSSIPSDVTTEEYVMSILIYYFLKSLNSMFADYLVRLC